MPDHRVRDVRILQGSNLVVGEVQVDGCDRVGQVRRFGCADDKRADRRAAHQPDKRGLCSRHTTAIGDCTDRVGGGGGGHCGASAPAASIVCRSAHYHPAPDVSDWKVPS